MVVPPDTCFGTDRKRCEKLIADLQSLNPESRRIFDVVFVLAWKNYYQSVFFLRDYKFNLPVLDQLTMDL